MKKQIIGSLIAISSLCAQNIVVTNVSIYSSEEKALDNKVLGIQSVDELVANPGTRKEVRLGISLREYAYYNRFRINTYLYSNSDKNNEVGAGVGFQINAFKNGKLSAYYSGFVGGGMQQNKGEVKILSTNANKANFISGDASYTPTEVKFEDDNTLMEYGFGLGANYQYSKNLTFDIGYIYRNKSYNVKYRQTGSVIENSITVDQSQEGINIGITYSFNTPI